MLSLQISATIIIIIIIIIIITQPVMVIRELYIVRINIYILDESLSTSSIIRKDIILITIYQKRERRKRLDRSESNPKRPFNNTLLSIKAIRIIRIITVRLVQRTLILTLTLVINLPLRILTLYTPTIPYLVSSALIK